LSNTIQASELKALLEKKQNISIIDVRRRADYDADNRIIPGSVWRDPEKTQEWYKELPKDKDVVIYCVRGGSVSKSVTETLLNHQVNARYVEGGVAAWEANEGAFIERKLIR
jgi:rhodanese-related sulfurtransferase